MVSVNKMEHPTDLPIVQTLTKFVEEFAANPNAELEVRLGMIVDGKFVAGVDAQHSMNLNQDMTDSQSIQMWKVHPLRHFKYLYFPDGLRGRYEGAVKTEFHKIVLRHFLTVRCLNRKYALKFALKEEIPMPEDTLTIDPPTYIRFNSRTTLELPDWKYEFTKVGEGVSEEIARKNVSHQVEIEVLHSACSKLSPRDLAITLLGRGRDLTMRYANGDLEFIPLEIVK